MLCAAAKQGWELPPITLPVPLCTGRKGWEVTTQCGSPGRGLWNHPSSIGDRPLVTAELFLEGGLRLPHVPQAGPQLPVLQEQLTARAGSI